MIRKCSRELVFFAEAFSEVICFRFCIEQPLPGTHVGGKSGVGVGSGTRCAGLGTTTQPTRPCGAQSAGLRVVALFGTDLMGGKRRWCWPVSCQLGSIGTGGDEGQRAGGGSDGVGGDKGREQRAPGTKASKAKKKRPALAFAPEAESMREEHKAIQAAARARAKAEKAAAREAKTVAMAAEKKAAREAKAAEKVAKAMEKARENAKAIRTSAHLCDRRARRKIDSVAATASIEQD